MSCRPVDSVLRSYARIRTGTALTVWRLTAQALPTTLPPNSTTAGSAAAAAAATRALIMNPAAYLAAGAAAAAPFLYGNNALRLD